jgi:hypothetical protein
MNSTACLIGLCYMGIIWGQCIGNHLFALEGTLARQTRKCPIVECTQQPLPFLVENPQRPRVHDWTRSVKTTSVWPVIQRAYDALFFRGYFVPLTLVSAREVCFSDFVRVRVYVSERELPCWCHCVRERACAHPDRDYLIIPWLSSSRLNYHPASSNQLHTLTERLYCKVLSTLTHIKTAPVHHTRASSAAQTRWFIGSHYPVDFHKAEYYCTPIWYRFTAR